VNGVRNENETTLKYIVKDLEMIILPQQCKKYLIYFLSLIARIIYHTYLVVKSFYLGNLNIVSNGYPTFFLTLSTFFFVTAINDCKK